MVVSWKVTKEKKKQKQTGTRKPERPAQQNKTYPNHYIYRDKRFSWNKKAYYYVHC